jgi:hypothetical protein
MQLGRVFETALRQFNDLLGNKLNRVSSRSLKPSLSHVSTNALPIALTVSGSNA